jgi:hypothetical protein
MGDYFVEMLKDQLENGPQRLQLVVPQKVEVAWGTRRSIPGRDRV